MIIWLVFYLISQLKMLALPSDFWFLKNEHVNSIDLSVYHELPLKYVVEKKIEVVPKQNVNKNINMGQAVIKNNKISQPSPEINAYVEKYSCQYLVNPQVLYKIAYCESRFNSQAVNGPYAGLFQFLSSTWQSNRKAMGLDPNPTLRFNAEESIRTAAFKISRDGTSAWPVCGR